jgi:hypothetical protein
VGNTGLGLESLGPGLGIIRAGMDMLIRSMSKVYKAIGVHRSGPKKQIHHLKIWLPSQIPPIRRQRARAVHRMPTLEPSDSEDEEYTDEASDHGDGDLANPTGVKHLY